MYAIRSYYGADAGSGLDCRGIAEGDRAGHALGAKRAEDGERGLGADPLHRDQQPMPFLLDQGGEAEELRNNFV